MCNAFIVYPFLFNIGNGDEEAESNDSCEEMVVVPFNGLVGQENGQIYERPIEVSFPINFSSDYKIVCIHLFCGQFDNLITMSYPELVLQLHHSYSLLPFI